MGAGEPWVQGLERIEMTTWTKRLVHQGSDVIEAVDFHGVVDLEV